MHAARARRARALNIREHFWKGSGDGGPTALLRLDQTRVMSRSAGVLGDDGVRLYRVAEIHTEPE